MIFAEKLVILRKKAGLSQEELADKLGVTRQAAYKWESNQSMPDIEKLKILSKLFDVSIDNLLNDKEDIFFRSEESDKSKKIPLGKVYVSEEKIENIDVETINTQLTKEEKKQKSGNKRKAILFSFGGWFLLFATFIATLSGMVNHSSDVDNWPTIFVLLVDFLFLASVACFVMYFITKRRMRKQEEDLLVNTSMIQFKEAEEKKMEQLGYTYISFQHDLPAWFFYDPQKNVFGFYFNGKEQFICPIQNYVKLGYMPYGDGLVSKTKLRPSVILGDVVGVGVHPTTTYSSSDGRLFAFTLTYFDENGIDMEYQYTLSAFRSYAIEKYSAAPDLLYDVLAKETLHSYKKIETKLNLEKNKFL